jgi:hypothetical protein
MPYPETLIPRSPPKGKPGTGKTTMICDATAIRELTGKDPVMLAPIG